MVAEESLEHGSATQSNTSGKTATFDVLKLDIK